MSRLKTGSAVIAVGLIAALAAGGVGAGMATTLVTGLYNSKSTPPVEEAEEYVVLSERLGEERPYQVHLPTGYDPDAEARYPVLIVLDGDGQAPHTARTADMLARMGLAPKMIVVGVHNLYGMRDRDFTPPEIPFDGGPGRADRFLAFLEYELLPEIDRRYRTDATRMIAGHSRGGFFVTYTLIARPDLFAARFAYSPSFWVGGEALIPLLEPALEAGAGAGSFFYMSLGDDEGTSMKGGFERAEAVLASAAPASLRWRADITERAGHGSNPRLSTAVGLHALFEPSAPY